MSQLAKQLFEGLKHIARDVGAHLEQKVELGASELVAGIQTGNAFVLYGPNQRFPNVEQEHSAFGPSAASPEHQHAPEHEHEMERER